MNNHAHSVAIAFLASVLVFMLGTTSVRDQHYRDEIDDLHSRIEELAKAAMIDGNSRELAPAQLSPAQPHHSFTYALDFGVVGDAVVDDAAALQAAIDSAAAGDTGGTVILPKGIFLIKSPLILPGGVTVKGQGYGSSPLAIKFDAGGSVLAYCGTDYAVYLDGHGVSLQDLAVYDWAQGNECNNIQAQGGVVVNANGRLLESITMSNVLIYWFMGGTSLTLKASNGGGIPYCNFQNIRIRHAHTGILLEADETSFVK